MNDFPLPGQDQIAGLQQFHFVQVEGVQSIPAVIDRVISEPVVMKAGYGWLKGYASIDSLSLQEKAQSDQQGQSVKATIEGFAPDQLALLQLFARMEGRSFIVKTIDNDGVSKIVGTLDEPLTFTFDYDTKTISHEKGYQFSFMGIVPRRSPVYQSANQGAGSQYLYNDVRVTSYDANGFPLVTEYYFNQTYLFTIEKSWNSQGVKTQQKVDGNKSFF